MGSKFTLRKSTITGSTFES